MKDGVVLYVNLTDQRIIYLTLPPGFKRHYLGGRGFTSRILYAFRNDIPDSPYDQNNIVVISSGILAGTEFPSTGRTTVATLKSPVTGRFCDGNLGGFFGPFLRMRGIDGIIIDGVSPTPVYIHIGDEIEIVKASERLWECGNEDATDYFDDTYGGSRFNQALTIGEAGINKVFCATVSNRLRTAGGGGIGAVLGSKKLKAIVVSKTRTCKPITPRRTEDQVAFSKLCERVVNHIKNHPVYPVFSVYGTTSLVEIHSAIKYFPSLNWREKVWKQWKKISGKAFLKYESDKNKNHLQDRKDRNEKCEGGCRNCPILCSGEDKVEYETLNCLGSKIGISDIDWIIRTNRLLNDWGLDVIQSTSIISALMEMSEDKISYFKFDWGDEGSVISFLAGLVFNNSPESVPFNFRDGFNEGIRWMMSHRKLNLVPTSTAQYYRRKYFPEVKGMAMSGVYPSHKNRGVALAVATSSRGADHLRSLPTLSTYASWYLGKGIFKKLLKMVSMPLSAMKLMRRDAKFLIGNLYENYTTIFGVPEPIVAEWKESNFLFNDGYSGWSSMVKFTQEMYAVVDSVSTCRFTSPWRFGIGPKYICEALNLLEGWNIGWKELLRVGERIYAVERDLQYYYGYHRDNVPRDSIPSRFFGGEGKLDDDGFEMMLDEYYKLCGYNRSGRPDKETISFLNIEDNIADHLITSLR